MTVKKRIKNIKVISNLKKKTKKHSDDNYSRSLIKLFCTHKLNVFLISFLLLHFFFIFLFLKIKETTNFARLFYCCIHTNVVDVYIFVVGFFVVVVLHT